MDVERCWQLARLWYEGRARRDWEPRSPAAMEGIFRACGLVGPFWELEPPGASPGAAPETPR